MHSVQHYRQRAAQVRRLTESVLDPALLEQLQMVACDYDRIADDLERPHSRTAGLDHGGPPLANETIAKLRRPRRFPFLDDPHHVGHRP
jgi:hypothetical protein